MLRNSKTQAFHPETLDTTILYEVTREMELEASVDLNSKKPTCHRETSVLGLLPGECCA